MALIDDIVEMSLTVLGLIGLVRLTVALAKAYLLKRRQLSEARDEVPPPMPISTKVSGQLDNVRFIQSSWNFLY